MRVAAIDLGSNSFHLLIVDAFADGHFVPLARDKETLRLGDMVSRERPTIQSGDFCRASESSRNAARSSGLRALGLDLSTVSTPRASLEPGKYQS